MSKANTPSPPLDATVPPALPPDIVALGFEEAMGELEKLVRRLEDGSARLDDAISAYERGSLLRRHCETKLREAKARIEKISATSNISDGNDTIPDVIPF